MASQIHFGNLPLHLPAQLDLQREAARMPETRANAAPAGSTVPARPEALSAQTGAARRPNAEEQRGIDKVLRSFGANFRRIGLKGRAANGVAMDYAVSRGSEGGWLDAWGVPHRIQEEVAALPSSLMQTFGLTPNLRWN